MWRVTSILAIVVCTLALASQVEAAKRVALVIGNSAYKNTAALANPKNDATDFATAMKTFGFHVIEGFDLDKSSMDAKVREFAEALEGAPAAVFFYAGHGLQVDGINYLVPVDAKLSTKAALDFEMVRLDIVQRNMEAERDRTSILFFDACRNNPLARNLASSMGTRSVNEGAGLAQQETGAGTLISYSTAPGNVAQDGEGRNSPYTGALVKQLMSSGDHLAEMLYEVRNSVMKETNGSQVPWENSALTQRFYFKQVAPPPVVATLPPATTLRPQSGPPAATDGPRPITPGETVFPPIEPPVALSPGVLDYGDLAMSGFSSTKLTVEGLKPGVHPIEKTVIDPDGASVRVFDMSKFERKDAAVLKPAVKLAVKAEEIGQVFGLTFDNANGTPGARPNLFAAATSQFGLQIVGSDADGDGKPDRLKSGGPNAVFMEGQFGTKLGGGPGAIWKIEGVSGSPTLFANVAVDGAQNSGPGLGDIAFDPVSGNLYVSDLDTGMIHRFDSAGTDLGRFDHGIVGRKARQLAAVLDDGKRLDISNSSFKSEDPATWGFTSAARRIHGLAVFDKRLYYAVDEGPEIWSVGIDPNGAFASDPRFELHVGAEEATARPTMMQRLKSYLSSESGLPVTDILFDAEGRMTIAQRGRLENPFDYALFAEPDRARVLRYSRPKAGAGYGPWTQMPDEYAVGFGGDYRQGSGGISLAFGRNEDGSIDFGQCEADLVATGDALRDNPSFASRLKAGGPSIVHGAQIAGAGRVRPANAPPLDSAFVDFDGSYDDASLRGQVGDVEIFRNCDASRYPPIAAGSPDVLTPGQSRPVGPGSVADLARPDIGGVGAGQGGPIGPETFALAGLKIDKKAVGADCSTDRGCTFEIGVTNLLSTPINGPIVIDEIVSAGKADLAGAVMSTENERPWICTRSPPFFCTHPEPIEPGVRVSLTVSIKPGATGEERELMNCASLHTPPDSGQPPTTAAVAGISVKPTTVKPTCSEAGGCELNVTLTNTTAEPFSGPATIIELFSSHRGKIAEGLGNNATLEENPTAPWTCARVGLPWRCTNNALELAPGASTSLTLKMKPGALGPEDRFLGSSTALEMPKASGATTSDFVPASFLLQRTDAAAAEKQKGRTMGGKRGQACAMLPLKPPAAQRLAEPPRLKIEKKAVSEFCSMDGPCKFEITITNVGGGPYNGPLSVSEQIASKPGAEPVPTSSSGSGRTSTATTSPDWSCAGTGPNATCASRHDVKLVKGQSIVLPVDVTPQGFGKGAVLENCATLKAGATDDGGAAQNILANDKACAPVELDPFSLRVIKSGVSTCAPGGACEFKLTLLNDGAVDHNAPVTFTDSMGPDVPSMDIVSIEPKLPCDSQPKRIPFECTTPGRHPLAKGQHEEYKIVTRVPAQGLPETIKNCVVVSKPWKPAPTTVSTSGPPDGAEPGSYECHEVAIGPATPACFGGMTLTADKLCECAEGTSWNGRTCAAAPVAACPSGWNGMYPYCCQAGMEYREGSCQKIVAKTECPDDRPNGEYPNCCPSGAYYSNGLCKYKSADEAKCPSGTYRRRGECRPYKSQQPTYKQQQQPPPQVNINLYKNCYGKSIPIWKKCTY